MHTENSQIYCPYCGENIEIVVDASVQEQHYIEDCSVCCRPIELQVIVNGEEIQVIPRRDDE